MPPVTEVVGAMGVSQRAFGTDQSVLIGPDRRARVDALRPRNRHYRDHPRPRNRHHRDHPSPRNRPYHGRPTPLQPATRAATAIIANTTTITTANSQRQPISQSQHLKSPY